MSELTSWEYIAFGLIFLWSGFVLSELGFLGCSTGLAAAVCLRQVSRQNLRETLIVLWGILVVFKMSAFVYSGVDRQLLHQVWLLPCAAIGHVMGLKVHQKLLTSTGNLFMRLLGRATGGNLGRSVAKFSVTAFIPGCAV